MSKTLSGQWFRTDEGAFFEMHRFNDRLLGDKSNLPRFGLNREVLRHTQVFG